MYLNCSLAACGKTTKAWIQKSISVSLIAVKQPWISKSITVSLIVVNNIMVVTDSEDLLEKLHSFGAWPTISFKWQ